MWLTQCVANSGRVFFADVRMRDFLSVDESYYCILLSVIPLADSDEPINSLTAVRTKDESLMRVR